MHARTHAHTRLSALSLWLSHCLVCVHFRSCSFSLLSSQVLSSFFLFAMSFRSALCFRWWKSFGCYEILHSGHHKNSPGSLITSKWFQRKGRTNCGNCKTPDTQYLCKVVYRVCVDARSLAEPGKALTWARRGTHIAWEQPSLAALRRISHHGATILDWWLCDGQTTRQLQRHPIRNSRHGNILSENKASQTVQTFSFSIFKNL